MIIFQKNHELTFSKNNNSVKLVYLYMSTITELLNKNSEHESIFKAAGKLGNSLGVSTYLVGGYIRDLLMDREANDIDIVVENEGIKFAEFLAKELNAKGFVAFEKFGTAQLTFDDYKLEITTAREETYSKNSRKPKVVFTDIHQDLSRRDFTVNAIAVSIMPNSYGEIFDPFGGIKDINKKILITPLEPDKTFIDDPLRMLRAIRFAAQLNFSIDDKVFQSISSQCNRLEIISKERITEELLKLLSTNKPSIGFNLMKDANLLKFVFPEMLDMPGVEKINGMGHKDVFIHTLQVIDNAAKLTNKTKIRFAALVHDIAKPITKRFDKNKGWTYHGHEEVGRRMISIVAKRMKLSNDLKMYLQILTKLHLRPIALAKKEITDSAVRRLIFEAGEFIDDLMILCRADITTKNPRKVQKYLNNFEKVEELIKDVKLKDEMKKFQSPVRGEIIMNDLGLTPGPEVGQIKTAIEEAILDGIIPNEYEAAYGFMLEIKDKIFKK